MRVRWSFLILLLVQVAGGGAQPAWGRSLECSINLPYRWPGNLQSIIDMAPRFRQAALGSAMDQFSSQVGKCYERELVGAAERQWMGSCRIKNLDEVAKVAFDPGSTVKQYCESVRANLVEKRLPNPRSDPSPYCQYANCGEGARVGACLAFAYGYPSSEILICESKHDHAWALIPEEGDPHSYCLLDRWNTFRCQVKLVGKGTKPWRGDAIVPGKAKFKFSEAVCRSLEDYRGFEDLK
ncbi:MAG: hypothetical protein RJB38_1860 [Pseudomonadota bacterium]|jgi:hypothetical protein